MKTIGLFFILLWEIIVALFRTAILGHSAEQQMKENTYEQ